MTTERRVEAALAVFFANGGHLQPKDRVPAMRAALAASDAAAWEGMDTAPRDRLIDVWLVGSEESEVRFYCGDETLCIARGVYAGRSTTWHWNNGKWRPSMGLHTLVTFIQPIRWRLPPAASGQHAMTPDPAPPVTTLRGFVVGLDDRQRPLVTMYLDRHEVRAWAAWLAARMPAESGET